MKWTKLNHIFAPDGDVWWMRTHASLPTPLYLGDNLYRIYFASRDEQSRSRIGYVEIDITEPAKILYITPRPVLDIGKLGAFDDSGVMPTSIVHVKDRLYLYYVGWMQGKNVRYYLHHGLAISKDGGKTFERYSRATISPQTEMEPYGLFTAPLVIYDGDLFRMWYGSGLGWGVINEKVNPKYNMRYAISKNGTTWKRISLAVDFAYSDEWAIGRCAILKTSDIYEMWFSYMRGKQGYRIGYAQSKDGKSWERDDTQAGISISENGWDSQMIEYPAIFKHPPTPTGEYYMLYNGNDYGRTGFGIARGDM